MVMTEMKEAKTSGKDGGMEGWSVWSESEQRSSFHSSGSVPLTWWWCGVCPASHRPPLCMMMMRQRLILEQ